MPTRTRRAPSRRGAQPQIPARFTQNYRILAPVRTHHRRATCAEVDCPSIRRAPCETVGCSNYNAGWKTILPAGSPLLEAVRSCGKTFLEKPAEAGLVEFIFPAGQQCFAQHLAPDVGPCQVEHWVSLDRPGIYAVTRPGLRTIRFGERADLWAEHWAEHADKVAKQRERLVT